MITSHREWLESSPTGTAAMPTVADQLRNLYPASQLIAMDKVREAMLDDPTIFDPHKDKSRADDEAKEQNAP